MKENHKKFLEELNKLQRAYNVELVIDCHSVQNAIADRDDETEDFVATNVFNGCDEWTYIE